MPKYHARAKAIGAIKTELGIKHTEATLVLDDPRCEILCHYIAARGLSTYAQAVAAAEAPENQLLCGRCGWTVAMKCPDCPGCGCYTGQCTNPRHDEYDSYTDDSEYGCPECGADGQGTYGCSCFNPAICPECGADNGGAYHCDCFA